MKKKTIGDWIHFPMDEQIHDSRRFQDFVPSRKSSGRRNWFTLEKKQDKIDSTLVILSIVIISAIGVLVRPVFFFVLLLDRRSIIIAVRLGIIRIICKQKTTNQRSITTNPSNIHASDTLSVRWFPHHSTSFKHFFSFFLFFGKQKTTVCNFTQQMT